MEGFRACLKWSSPVRVAFLGSLLLSLVAVLGEVTIGKDGAFYVDLAVTFIEFGVRATFDRFDWPWFSIFLAFLHSISGISIELLAYLVCALFMAGTCTLIVDMIIKRFPQVGYWACLVVLSMPAFNAFRGDVLREYGFWFFSILALWLVVRWYQGTSWTGAVLVQLSIGLAALFRLEAVLLIPAFAIWQITSVRSWSGVKSSVQLNALPAVVFLAVVGWVVLGAGLSAERLDDYAELLSPSGVARNFKESTEDFSREVLHRFAEDDAGHILFLGLFGSAVLMFLKLLGPFAVPLLFKDGRAAVGQYVQQFKPFAWVFLFYFAVIMLFYAQQLFMNSRYISFLNLLAVPAVTLAFFWFVGRFPRWGKVLGFVAFLVMFDNVLSFSAKKTHYVESGHWVAQNLSSSASIYYADSRISYHAGRGYPKQRLSTAAAMSDANQARFDYFVIEADVDEVWLIEWMQQHNKRILSQFANRKGDTVLVLGN
jgi:4-amino-4-deoxy-L-arabinose transferase-like glycosyltransferase